MLKQISLFAANHKGALGKITNDLARENITQGVFLTGNTVIDALQTTVRPQFTFQEEILNRLDYAARSSWSPVTGVRTTGSP